MLCGYDYSGKKGNGDGDVAGGGYDEFDGRCFYDDDGRRNVDDGGNVVGGAAGEAENGHRVFVLRIRMLMTMIVVVIIKMRMVMIMMQTAAMMLMMQVAVRCCWW